MHALAPLSEMHTKTLQVIHPITMFFSLAKKGFGSYVLPSSRYDLFIFK